MMPFILSAAVFLVAAQAQADSAGPADAFARQLAREGDHYRAISEFKRLAFDAQTAEERARWRYEIGKELRLSNHGSLALEELSNVMASPAAPRELRSRAAAQVALSLIDMKVAPQALSYARMAAPDYPCLARLLQIAATHKPAPEVACADALVETRAARLADEALRSDARERAAGDAKSPTAAVLLSAVVPGAGQLYTGHSVDAMQAFGFVAASGFMTYIAARYDYSQNNDYWLTAGAGAITAVFYGANLVGAHRTATYANQRQKEQFQAPLRRSLLQFDF